MRAINEYALSLINYYCRIIDIEPCEYAALDVDVRKLPTDNRLHFKPANRERLYLLRKHNGRGLANIEG